MNVFKFIDAYNAIAGAIIAVASAIMGPHWYIFGIYFVLNIIDWLSGWYRSRKLQQESSKIGLKGIIKKLGYWAIIAVAFMVAYVFVRMGDELLHIDLSFLAVIGWFTTACLLVNEVRSILENLVECGYQVPQILIKGLAVANKLINKKEEEKEEQHEG